MNKSVQDKRLACSIFLSSIVHGIILVPFIVISIVCYASSSEVKEESVPVTFVFKEDVVEETQLPKKIEEDSSKEKDVEYDSVVGVENNEAKEVDTGDKLTDKIVKLRYDQYKDLQEVESIKEYFHEMHILKFCPSETDMLVIDSYVNNTHHVIHNPTKSDVAGYSYDTKTCDFKDLREMKSSVSEILKNEGVDSTKYSKVCILVPMKYWLYIIDTCDESLSKYKLRVQDKSVEMISIKYVRSGKGWVIKPVFALVRQGDRVSKILF